MKNPFKRGTRTVLKGPDDRMTLRDHLAELRVRIVRSMLAIVVGVIIMMAFYDPILRFIKRPYTNLCDRRGPDFCTDDLYALGPSTGFTTRISISLYGGIDHRLPRRDVADLALHRAGPARQGEEVRDPVHRQHRDRCSCSAASSPTGRSTRRSSS